MEGDPSLEAEPIAQVTADPSIEGKVVVVIYPYSRLPAFGAIRMDKFVVLLFGWVIGFFTGAADLFAKTFRQYTQHGIGKVESIAAQIQESRDSFDGAIRMHSAEHEMASERGFNCNISRFLVAHLADHDDIGVRTQKSPHGDSKGQSDFWMDLHLA